MSKFGNIKIEGITSILNSTIIPLGSGLTFTGTGEQNHLQQVGVMVKTDNSGTLFFDFSNDGTNWDSSFPVNGFQVAANISEFHTAIKLGRWFRVRFVNNTGVQTFLRLTTYYGSNFVPSSAPLNQIAGIDQDAIFTRGSIPQDEIRIGRRSGIIGWNKFGYRDGLTATGGEEMIWADGVNFIPLTSPETFDILYDGTLGGSTDGAGTTGARELTIFYVDDNGLESVGTHTLGTDGTDTTVFSGLGINRAVVTNTGTLDYNANDITVIATTATTLQGIIPAMGSVTQQALFFVGSNHTGVAKYLRAHVTVATKTAVVLIKGYIYNRSLNVRYEIFREKIDTAVSLELYVDDPVGFALSATDILYFIADSDSDNVDITLRFSLNEYQNI